MKQFLIWFFCALSINLSAQSISGHVYKDGDKAPAQFANVALFSMPDTNFLSGVVTYMEGDFKIDNVTPGDYLIKISFMGFENKDIPVTVDSKGVQLDDIFLVQASQEIEEVEVTGNMIRGKEMVDRTVYTIPPDIEKSSTTGYDVLKKIPSVNVDFNNNISIAGKNNYIIEIDGKQRDAEFLNRIMPEDIEAVEIIHNPSGRYDGTIDAVLVIRLKPEARVGVSGNVGSMLKPIGKTTAAVNGGIDYGLEKVTFYVSGFSFIQNLENTSNVNNKFLAIDSVVNQQGTGDFGIVAASLNAGADYYINKKNTLSINYNLRPNRIENNLGYNGDVFSGGERINTNGSQTDMNNSSSEHNISLFYKRSFDKPIQELTSENNFYYYSNNENNNFYNEFLALDGTIIDSINRDENSTNERNYISSKWNYVHPLGMSMRFETGVQFYYQWMDYSFKANYDTNTFNYNELRNAAYAGITFNKKKFGFQATLRLERSDIEINDTSSNGYFTLLPSANLQYKFNSNHNLKFTYNRRINRPGIHNLNPNIRYTNTESYTMGNPGLEPELRDRLQLAYTVNIKKSFITSQLYYEFLKDKTSTRSYLKDSETGNSIIVSQPQNLLTGYEAGFGLSGFVKFVYLDARVYTGHINEFKDDYTTIEPWDYKSFSITNYYTAPLFKEKVHVFAFLNYQGIRYEAQRKTYSPFIYGLGGNYKYKDHTFGIFYLLPFQKELQFGKTITETEYLYTQSVNKFETNYFIQVQYHYKFNKGKAVKKIGKKVDIESDTKGGGIGQ